MQNLSRRFTAIFPVTARGYVCSYISLLIGSDYSRNTKSTYVAGWTSRNFNSNQKFHNNNHDIYISYHRYREITGGPPLRLHRKPDSKAGRRNWNALTSHGGSLDWYGLWFLLSVNFWAILNHLPLLRFLLAQNDIVVCHPGRNFNKIMTFSSGIILCSHLFTCFCTSSTDFRSTGYA